MKHIALKMRRLATTSAFVISIITAQFAGMSFAHAAITGDTWTGAGDGTSFSDASNWQGSAAPVNGDNLIFDNTSLSADATINNDMSNLSIGILRFNGTNTTHKYILQGNALSVTNSIDSNNGTAPGYDSINLAIKIAADGVALSYPLWWGASSSIDTQGHSVSMSNASASSSCYGLPALIGSGSVSSGTINGTDGYSTSLTIANSPSFTGTFSLSNGTVYMTKTTFPTASSVSVTGNGILSYYVADGDTIVTPLNLSGTGSIAAQHASSGGCSGGSDSNHYTVSLTGAVSLGSDFKYSGDDNLNITGTYNANSHAFTVANGAAGILTLPTGSVEATAVTNTYTDSQPSTYLGVGNKETDVLDGTRGSVYVGSAGTLMGTGTAQNLTIDTGGIIAPGHSPGKLTVQQTLTLNSGSTYQAQLQTSAAGGYDQIQVSDATRTTGNDVQINSATLDTSLYAGYNIKQGDTFTIIDNLQPSTQLVQGTFNGLAEGAQFTASGITFSISYIGGDGNDVVLTALNTGKDPGTPNTGAQMLKLANPVALIGLGVVAAGVLIALARRRTN